MAKWIKYRCEYTRNSRYEQTEWKDYGEGWVTEGVTMTGYVNYSPSRDSDGTYRYGLTLPQITISASNLGTVYNWQSATGGKTIIKTTFYFDEEDNHVWASEEIRTINTIYTSDYYYNIGDQIGSITASAGEYPDASNGYTYVTVYDGYTIMRNGSYYYAYILTDDTDETEPASGTRSMYIGINKELPIYESEDADITVDNISNYFTVTNGSYYFKGSGNIFTSNNSGKASSEASTTLKALKDTDVSFSYSYSSESNFDKFTLIVGDETVESAVSGATTTKSYTGSLKAGQTIVFKYSKDSSQDKNDDKCTFYDMSITTKVEVGKKLESVAHKATKLLFGDFTGRAQTALRGYIGDRNGVAQLFYSSGAVHIHAYIQSELTFDDDTNADQHTYTKTCSSCGRVVTVWEDHEYELVSQNATCTVAGYTKDVCDCGKEINYTEIAATGHTSVSTSYVAPTCTSSGRYAGTKCSVCGVTLSGRDYIAPLGHDWDRVIETVEPTCTEQGYDVEQCRNCDATQNINYVDAPGHDYIEDGAKAPTCTEDGEVRWTCRRCDEAGYIETIPAPGHSYTAKTYQPSCTARGFTRHTCSACGVYYDDTYVAPTGHTEGSEVDCYDATCTEDGWVKYRCATCYEYYTETIPATGHYWVDATCTEPKTCRVCGATEGAALGHIKDELAWCPEGITCSVCGYEMVAPRGCTYGEGVVTPPTCTTDGYTVYTCEVCGAPSGRCDYVPAAHTPGAAATCTTAQVCTVCKEVLEEALGHSLNAFGTVCLRCGSTGPFIQIN